MTTMNRNETMVEMACAGMTYQAIGDAFGVSRERVRQVVGRAGVSGATTRAARAAAQAAALEADRVRVLEWARANPGLEARDAEAALGLAPGRVQDALGADVGNYFVRGKPAYAFRWSDDDVVQALRDAAVVQGDPLTKVAYDEYVAAFGGPSGVRVVQRFGTWKNACRAAGLGVSTHTGNCHRRWGQGQLVDLLLDYFGSTGARGSYSDYERWAAEAPGRPSGPTIRNRFGSWTAAKRAALAAGAADRAA